MLTELEQKILDRVSEQSLVRRTMELVDIPSPTGHERDVAIYLYEAMLELGLKVKLQTIGPERFNVVGVLQGTGGGASLMFNGHMDTSYTGQEADLIGTGYKPKAHIVEDQWIYGSGSRNMKSALAAYLEAVKALKEANAPLRGDVVIAAVCGEIERSPVDEFTGADYDGYGIGSKHLVTRGVVADMAIIGEPTVLTLVPAHMGSVWAKISTKGTMAHTAWYERAVNAIDEMMIVRPYVKDWATNWERQNSYKGTHAKVNISAIRGGLPYRANRTPVGCDLYMDIRVLPDQRCVEVQHALQDLLARIKADHPQIQLDLDLYNSTPGAEISDDHPVVAAVAANHERLLGVAPSVETAVFFSDAAHLNRYGVPTLNYGPAGRLRDGGTGWSPGEGEHQFIPDLVNAARVYALTALDICSRAPLS